MAYQSDNYFKKYNRGQRQQTTEETFNLGMQFTNAPLKQGACRLPINFDIKSNGEVLVPRPALQTVKISGEDTPQTHPLIVDGRTSAEPTGTYEQVLLGSVTATKVTDTELYKGSILPITITPSETELYLSQLEGVATEAIFKKPTSATIHNMPISDTSPMATNVGTFGFNNSYYCFNPTTKALQQTRFITDRYKFESLIPKTLTPKEAVMWGYNMLQTNAYLFSDTEAAGAITLLGLLPYKADSTLALNAKVNETVKLRCYYAGPSANTYKIKWEWKEVTGTDWTNFKEETKALTGLPQITADFSFPAEELMVRVTFTKDTETYPEQVLTVAFNLAQTDSGNTNLKQENYDLSTASGMTYWKNRLVVYGLHQDKTVLFMSDINDPTYFPYPNNADLFDEPIIHVLPFLDDLLIFTSTKLHLLALSEDGLSWNKKNIQSNLDIKEWDIHLIQQVKNMVFFKSGNYFYMVVPSLKTTTFGNLVVTPISRNIEYLLDSYKENIDSIVKLLYNYDVGLELVHYYNFLDYEDVHNTYTFSTQFETYLNVALLYNTITRAWRFHIFESSGFVKPYKQDATKKGTFISVLNGGVQFLQYNANSAKDNYYDTTYIQKTPLFKNYQLLDTGYREIDTDYNKRYREFQLKFNNISQKTLSFATEFFIDGELRQNMYDYEVVHITDPEDPRYLSIVVEKKMVQNVTLPGATVLAEDQEDAGAWELDTSRFPDLFLWKVRIPVSGKGLSPRMQIVSFNEEIFELMNITWVYRKMNSR